METNKLPDTPITVQRGRKFYYNSVWSPINRFIVLGHKVMRSKGECGRIWRFDLWGMLFDPFDGMISGCYAWDRSLSPSWGCAFDAICNNVLQFLTPFYRPRRALLRDVIERNGMKLLDNDRKSCYLRNRKSDCVYCEVTCGFFTATAKTIRYVDRNDGNGVCTFLEGTENADKEERIVAHGPCLTWKQCDRLFDTIVRATPELEWNIQ